MAHLKGHAAYFMLIMFNITEPVHNSCMTPCVALVTTYVVYK